MRVFELLHRGGEDSIGFVYFESCESLNTLQKAWNKYQNIHEEDDIDEFITYFNNNYDGGISRLEIQKIY